jgi:hypothetical protein
MKDGNAIENGAASSETTAGDFANRSTIARRVESARARRTTSSSPRYLGTHLTIMAGQGSVNRRCCLDQADHLASGNRSADSNRGYAVRGSVAQVNPTSDADATARIDSGA